MVVAKRQGRSEDQSEDFRQNKQHSWLSPIFIGRPRLRKKTYKRRSQSAFSRALFLSRVCVLFLSLSLSHSLSPSPACSSTLFSVILRVGMPSCFEDGFSCYLLNKTEL